MNCSICRTQHEGLCSRPPQRGVTWREWYAGLKVAAFVDAEELRIHMEPKVAVEKPEKRKSKR